MVSIAGPRVTRSFRYLNCWALSPQFHCCVKASWDAAIYGSKIGVLFQMLKALKSIFKDIHGAEFRSMKEKEKQYATAYTHLRRAEIRTLHQKAKVQHLKLNDDNTQQAVAGAFLEFYKSLLGTDTPVVEPPDELFMTNCLPDSEWAFLTRQVTDAWSTVGADFQAAVQDYFARGILPKAANSTLITLVPKSETPQAVSDFRPMLYYFLQDELGSRYTRKYLSPRCILKIDIRKAFDSGLRQGDPLSPYFFVLCMEVLSRLLRKLPTAQGFSYHPKCVKLNLTHLVFADDLLVFTRGDVPSVLAVAGCLSDFSAMTRLCANPLKTCIYFGGVEARVIQEIVHCSGFTQGDLPFRYLGIPFFPARLTEAMFLPLLDKIKEKLMHWANYSLSYAGKKKSNASWYWANVLHVRDSLLVAFGSKNDAAIFLGNIEQKYSATDLYEVYWPKGAKVGWSKLVMDTISYPAHTFTSMMAFSNALPTMENLI
ncbi:uncharacterized protein LOC141601939 [Silene latifolia]|uniref:uncharacterized protein LOC141601939 n=1 Tax=Silene latifolia TaxID=37657 RepID=UPI003D771B88